LAAVVYFCIIYLDKYVCKKNEFIKYKNKKIGLDTQAPMPMRRGCRVQARSTDRERDPQAREAE